MIEVFAICAVMASAIVALVLICNRIDNRCVALTAANEDLQAHVDKHESERDEQTRTEVREHALREALESLSEADIGLAKLALRMVYGQR